MANTEFNVRIQLKRDTDANWRVKDPQLLAGEVVFVDTNAGEVRTKVGDGTKKYSALPFMDEVLRNLISNADHLFKVKATCDLTGNTTTPTISEHGDIGEILSMAIDQTQPIVAEVESGDDKFWLPLVYFNPDKEEASFIGPINDASVWFKLGFQNGDWSSERIDLAKLTDIPTKLSQLENDTNYLNSDTNFVHKTGDEEIKGIKTFESSIICPMTPGNENHLVNKKYVDDKVGTYLPLAGGTLTGNLDLGTKSIKNFKDLTFANTMAIAPALIQNDGDTQSHIYLKFSQGTNNAHITGVAYPLADADAANKEYVDSAISTISSSYLSLSGGEMMGNNSIISNIGQLEFKYSFVDKRVILTANDDTFEIKGNLQITDVMIPTAAILKAGANGLIYTDEVIPPTNDNQYVQKGYVDSVIGGIENGTY